MRLKIAHLTHYQFAEPAVYGLQQIRLIPKTRRGQSVDDWNVTFEGALEQVHFIDQFNNHTLLIGLEEGANELVIRAEGTVVTQDESGIVGQHGGCALPHRVGPPALLARRFPRSGVHAATSTQ